MQALHIYAGPKAKHHIFQHGLRPEHVGIIPGAAGGPKGLILGPLDRFIFGHWLARSAQPVHLVGASIGAWRLATACLHHTVEAFERLEHDYIRLHYAPLLGHQRVTPQQVSNVFSVGLTDFFAGHLDDLLAHPRYRLHIITSRGRAMLREQCRWATFAGYGLAYASNMISRRLLGWWFERVVFSAAGGILPFDVTDYPTRHIPLSSRNFMQVLQASCAIPFALNAVHDIVGAPRAAYWDGGITDYHVHLNFQPPTESPIVLYPHFQQQVIPGWLDKKLGWRQHSTSFLDHVVVLAPNPEWVTTLPHGKLPDRRDFVIYAHDPQARKKVWTTAVQAAQQLADEFALWLEKDASAAAAEVLAL